MSYEPARAHMDTVEGNTVYAGALNSRAQCDLIAWLMAKYSWMCSKFNVTEFAIWWDQMLALRCYTQCCIFIDYSSYFTGIWDFIRHYIQGVEPELNRTKNQNWIIIFSLHWNRTKIFAAALKVNPNKKNITVTDSDNGLATFFMIEN